MVIFHKQIYAYLTGIGLKVLNGFVNLPRLMNFAGMESIFSFIVSRVRAYLMCSLSSEIVGSFIYV